MPSFFSDDEDEDEEEDGGGSVVATHSTGGSVQGARLRPVQEEPLQNPGTPTGQLADTKAFTAFSDDESSVDGTSDGRQELLRGNAELKQRSEQLHREAQQWKGKAEALEGQLQELQNKVEESEQSWAREHQRRTSTWEAECQGQKLENILLTQQVREHIPMASEDERAGLLRGLLQAVGGARETLQVRGVGLLQESERIAGENWRLQEATQRQEQHLEEEEVAAERLRSEVEQQHSEARSSQEADTSTCQSLGAACQALGEELSACRGVESRCLHLAEEVLMCQRTERAEALQASEAHRQLEEELLRERHSHSSEATALRESITCLESELGQGDSRARLSPDICRAAEEGGERLQEVHQCLLDALAESRYLEGLELQRLQGLCNDLESELYLAGSGPQNGVQASSPRPHLEAQSAAAQAQGQAQAQTQARTQSQAQAELQAAVEDSYRQYCRELEGQRLKAKAEVAEARSAAAQLRAELAACEAERVVVPERRPEPEPQQRLRALETRCQASAGEVNRLSKHLAEQALRHKRAVWEERGEAEERLRRHAAELERRCTSLAGSLSASEAENELLRAELRRMHLHLHLRGDASAGAPWTASPDRPGQNCSWSGNSCHDSPWAAGRLDSSGANADFSPLGPSPASGRGFFVDRDRDSASISTALHSSFMEASPSAMEDSSPSCLGQLHWQWDLASPPEREKEMKQWQPQPQSQSQTPSPCSRQARSPGMLGAEAGRALAEAEGQRLTVLAQSSAAAVARLLREVRGLSEARMVLDSSNMDGLPAAEDIDRT